MPIEYKINQSTFQNVYQHLVTCDQYFVPSLSQTVDINDYSIKLISKANRIECWDQDCLVGLVAVYFNDKDSFAFITNVSVLSNYLGLGIAKTLIQNTVAKAKMIGATEIRLEVNKLNIKAISLYQYFDFEITEQSDDSFFMKKIF